MSQSSSVERGDLNNSFNSFNEDAANAKESQSSSVERGDLNDSVLNMWLASCEVSIL